MANLKIEVYRTDQVKPETVVNIPLTVVRIAARFLPKRARLALENEGIDVKELASLVEKNEVTGKLAEVEKGTERIVISIE